MYLEVLSCAGQSATSGFDFFRRKAHLPDRNLIRRCLWGLARAEETIKFGTGYSTVSGSDGDCGLGALGWGSATLREATWLPKAQAGRFACLRSEFPLALSI